MIVYYPSVKALSEDSEYHVYRDEWSTSQTGFDPRKLVLEYTSPDLSVETIYGHLPYSWDIA